MQIRVFEKHENNLCVAFLTNNHSKIETTLNFRGKEFYLPAHSISVLPDCKTVVFNTQHVTNFLHSSIAFQNIICQEIYPLPRKKVLIVLHCLIQIVSQHSSRNFVRSQTANHHNWEMFSETIPTVKQQPVDSKFPQELYTLLKDTTDYGWYTTR